MKIRSREPAFYLFFLPIFLIFFATPYLFDLVFCEELYATQLSQAALIDAEKLESDGKSSCASLESANTDDVAVSLINRCFSSHCLLEGSPFGAPIPVLLTSRPPPAF